MNIQYYHGTKQKGYLQEFTVAVIMPDKDPFLDFLAMTLDDSNIEIEIDVGITKVNPKDMYNKKIGLKESSLKLKPETFKVNSISYSNNQYKVELKNENIILVLRISNKGQKIHLIEVL